MRLCEQLLMRSDQNERRIANISLLQAIVDQFVSRPTHPVADIRQFERLALGLIDVLEAETAARIAAPLFFHAEAPPQIFERLREKVGGRPKLAPEFPPEAALADRANAQKGSAALARAIARRDDLDREMVDALAHREEPEVRRALAANRSAHLDASARRALTQAARDDRALARILLDRDDQAIEPEALFLAATRAERAAMIFDACRRALAGGMAETRRADSTFVLRLEMAAVRKERDQMAALLGDALECPKARAHAILSDDQGEALALAWAALGIDLDAATRLFLCADPAISHEVDRVRALLALMRSTPQRAAAQIVVAFTGAARAEREPPRRISPREEESSRRRASPRLGVESLRKRDQTA
jgi:hypothetical protein